MKRLDEKEVRRILAPHGDVLGVWTAWPQFGMTTPFRKEWKHRVDYDASGLEMLERALPAEWARKKLEEWEPR